MNFAVSNIAWPLTDDVKAYELLASEGIRHLEIAPPRFWPDLSQAEEADVRKRTEEIALRGLKVCAFQALLFGRPELQVFSDDGGTACLDYLKSICRIAGWTGAGALVFGSPKNRIRGTLSRAGATKRAVDFFRYLGDAAIASNTVMCVEPNPAEYGGDFLLTVEEAGELVCLVDSPGIKLNLDMGELIMNKADVGRSITQYLPLAGHFHASEPMLAPFDPNREAHQQAAAALQGADYQGVVSLEMKTPAQGLPAVVEAARNLLAVYG